MLVGVLQGSAGRVDDVATDHHEIGARGHGLDDRHGGVLGNVAFAGIPKSRNEGVSKSVRSMVAPVCRPRTSGSAGLAPFVAGVAEQFG